MNNVQVYCKWQTTNNCTISSAKWVFMPWHWDILVFGGGMIFLWRKLLKKEEIEANYILQLNKPGFICQDRKTILNLTEF